MGTVLSLRGLSSAFSLVLLCALALHAQSRDQLAPTLSSAHRAFSVFAPRGHSALLNATGPHAIDSIPTFSGEFHANGIGPNGTAQHKWFYEIAGSRPEASRSARPMSRSRLIPGKTTTADFMPADKLSLSAELDAVVFDHGVGE